METTLLIVSVAIATTVVAVAFILWLQQKHMGSVPRPDLRAPVLGPQSDSGNMAINALAIKLRAQITSTRWFSEMLLYKQQGKLNFAQMEMLHQINSACREACKLLNDMFDAINTQVPGAVAEEVMNVIDEKPMDMTGEQTPAVA